MIGRRRDVILQTNRWIQLRNLILWLVALAALALAIVAFFFPQHVVDTVDLHPPSSLPCTSGLIHSSCLPNTVQTWNVLDLLMSQNTILKGETTCSGQPVNQNCIPEIPASKLLCDQIIGEDCIPDNITFANVNLTQSMQCQSNSSIDLNCLPDDIPSSKLFCDVPLNSTCIPVVDIPEVPCVNPLNLTCIPDIPSSKITCDTPLNSSCLLAGMDNQIVHSLSVSNTTSTTYEDLEFMTLTTSNSGFGRYMIFVNVQVEQSSSSATTYLILNINGVDVTTSEVNVQLESMNANTVSTFAMEAMVPNGVVIKVRWHMEGPGNLSAQHRQLMIHQIE